MSRALRPPCLLRTADAPPTHRAGAGAADPLAAEFEAAAAELQLVSTFAAAAGPDLPLQLALHRGSVVKLSRGGP